MDSVVRDWTEQQRETLRVLASAAGGEIALRLALREVERLASDADQHAAVAERYAAQAAELAQTLQLSLLPARAPDVPGLQIAARFDPGGTGVDVMGDFYDVFPIDGGIGVVIGDVCGKGPTAARSTAMARSAVRTVAHSDPDAASVLRTVNEVLRVWFDGDEFSGRTGFVSAIYATLRRPGADTGAWLAKIANAGHPPAFLRRGSGEVERLAGGGMIIGFTDEATVVSEDVELRPGDSLVLYTDGVTEAHRAGDDEQLDEAGVADVLDAAAPCAHAAELAEALITAANIQAAETATDDAGVVVIRIRP